METIKSNSDISELFALGKRYSNKYVTVLVANIRDADFVGKDVDKRGPHGRVAFIAGKKNGNSVWRNSAKRRLREIYRISEDLLNNHAVLMIAKPALLNDPYSLVLATCKNTFMKINDA